jgi:hypothetical protein
MGGGLIQLVAYGSQDIYLTSQPQVTFFKAIYKRHTHFAMESILQSYDGNADFGDTISVIIARNGDLVGNITVEAQLPDAAQFGLTGYSSFGWIQGVGNYLISRTAIYVGGQRIDEQYGSWMDVWGELNINGSQVEGYGKMIGKDYSSPIYVPYDVTKSPGNRLFIPLQYWFCRNPGLAIPLIALQYHEIKLEINIERYSKLLLATIDGEYVKPDIINPNEPPVLESLKVYSEYYFLDSSERKKFAQNPHEYLIEQVQSQSGNMNNIYSENIIRMNLNHPTKELIFVFGRNNSNAPQNDYSLGNNKIPEGTAADFAPLYSMKLLINGHDRFKERPGEYFHIVQPYQHHTRIPGNYIYSYSFALRPEEHQPSGTCNFSRIDNSHLVVYFRNKTVNPGNQDSLPEEDYLYLPSYTLWAPSYNIFRVMGGMGGLSYSN